MLPRLKFLEKLSYVTKAWAGEERRSRAKEKKGGGGNRETWRAIERCFSISESRASWSTLRLFPGSC
jgi:hypothetical protein